MFGLNRRAQSTAEYAIVIALVIGAVVAMQVYVRRGLQGRMKGAIDTYLIGGTSDPATGIPKSDTDGLYEPGFTERFIDQTRTSPTYEDVSKDAGKEGQITRGIGTVDNPEGTETTSVAATSYEKFGAPQ